MSNGQSLGPNHYDRRTSQEAVVRQLNATHELLAATAEALGMINAGPAKVTLNIVR